MMEFTHGNGVAPILGYLTIPVSRCSSRLVLEDLFDILDSVAYCPRITNSSISIYTKGFILDASTRLSPLRFFFG